jgi:hypothetical protein
LSFTDPRDEIDAVERLEIGSRLRSIHTEFLLEQNPTPDVLLERIRHSLQEIDESRSTTDHFWLETRDAFESYDHYRPEPF